MNDKYVLYALAFSFIFVSGFILLSFSEVKIIEEKFTRLYFNSTILSQDNNLSSLDGAEIIVRNNGISINDSDPYLIGDSFFFFVKGYTLNMISNSSILLYNYTKKTDGKIYFDFTVENFEGEDKNYTYQIYIDDIRIIEENEFVKANEKRIIEKEIEYNVPGEHRLKIKLNTGAEVYFNFSSVKK